MSEDRYVVVNGRGEVCGEAVSLVHAQGGADGANRHPAIYTDPPYRVMRVTLTPVEDEPRCSICGFDGFNRDHTFGPCPDRERCRSKACES